MTDLKPEDLVKLREIAEKATDGKWHVSPRGQVRADGGYLVALDCHERDAAFIAAFNPQVALSLLADRARMEKALIQLRDCDWTIGIGDRMDPVREIARKALGVSPNGK